MKRNAAQMKLSIKMAENKPDLPDGKTEQAVREIAGQGVTGLPLIEREAALPEVYCVNLNGSGKRSARLPGKSAAGASAADGADMVRDLQKEKTWRRLIQEDKH